MDKVSGLDTLRDLHLPKPIDWWPLAPGWYALILLGVAVIAFISFSVYKRRRRGRFKRQALELLANYEKSWKKGALSQEVGAQLSELLRRVALVYYPREDVASLKGQVWLDFLNQTSKNIDFNAVRDNLLELPYQSETHQADLTLLFVVVRTWINQRGVPCLN